MLKGFGSAAAAVASLALSDRAAAARPVDGGPRVRDLPARLTLDEKISLLRGATDPERLGQAGYLPGVPRLRIPPLRMSDGPAGINVAASATGLPPVSTLAASYNKDLAREYGRGDGT
ncbi:hypothetical protein ACIBBD_34565 [Streptomyces sp. NPDC051315]|uniref:hypothetical protein n=1 Tax=Streptomyces sp. NPDC051315 TaxID=3365650 RepID=UPI00379FBF65